jgi:hypothetical protein
MKAITIKNPWGYLCASGIKDIENRMWRTNYRGKVLIHVSAKTTDVEFTSDQLNDLSLNNIDYSGAGYPKEWQTVSAIIGEVEIIDCVVNHESIWAEKTEIIGTTIDGEPMYKHKPIWNWVLANPVLYEKPILNVKGKLSFWQYKEEEEEEEESICESCTAGMCEICSERHTSSKYQLKKEMESEYYDSQSNEIIEKKEVEERKMQRGDIIDYQYACGSSSDVVKAEVTWIDSQGFYVKYDHPSKGLTEEKAKVW